jgi:hypothetical protein
MDPLTLALTVGGGLLSAGGSIADRLRQRRESRRAIADLEPYTDPLQGFAQSRGILEAMNQMGTGNLAQLAARMGGSQGAAQAAGAQMGSQALSNAYLGALETGRQRAFQAQAMQNQLRDTQSLLGGTMQDIGGVAMDVGIRRMMGGNTGQQPQTSQQLMSTAAPIDDIPEADDLDLTMLSNVQRPSVSPVATYSVAPMNMPSMNTSALPSPFEMGVPEMSRRAQNVLNFSTATRAGNLFDTLMQGTRNRMALRRGSQMQMPQQQIPSIGGFNPMARFNPNRIGSITAGPMGVYGGPRDLAARRQASNPYSLDSLIQSGVYGNLFNPGVR